MDSVNRPSKSEYRDVEVEFVCGSTARYRVYASMLERIKDIFYGTPSSHSSIGYIVCYGIHEDVDPVDQQLIVTVNDYKTYVNLNQITRMTVVRKGSNGH